jgi:hypothetical protein
MKMLWKFHWDCERMGSVEGIFAAETEEVFAAIGKKVYFGEILGKHSEICGKLKDGDIVQLIDDEDFIAKAEMFGIIPSGYNPLEYLTETVETVDKVKRGDDDMFEDGGIVPH